MEFHFTLLGWQHACIQAGWYLVMICPCWGYRCFLHLRSVVFKALLCSSYAGDVTKIGYKALEIQIPGSVTTFLLIGFGGRDMLLIPTVYASRISLWWIMVIG